MIRNTPWQMLSITYINVYSFEKLYFLFVVKECLCNAVCVRSASGSHVKLAGSNWISQLSTLLFSSNLESLMLHIGMARLKLTKGQKWQVIDMSRIGNSGHNISDKFGINRSVTGRLLKAYRTAGNFRERRCSGRPRKTIVREDRELFCRARAKHFSTGKHLWEVWLLPSRVSVLAVTRRLNDAGLK